MRLKRKVKKALIIMSMLTVAATSGFIAYKVTNHKKPVQKEIKIVGEVNKYDYKLKENKPKKYKDLFSELKEILSQENVDEEKYVKKISEMFIYDFYSLNDKTAKTDIGGVEFVYKDALENFLVNAQDTYYKYVESNIYGNRKQSLPIVDEIKINNVEKKEYAYNEEIDNEAYVVNVTWTYTDNNFQSYQSEAELIFIHDDIKLSLVELK